MKLHIGGKEYKEGWKILNIQPAQNVDYLGTMADLSQFDEESCGQIYASHVFEHVKLRDALPTLQGILRILQPGGCLMLSVPDLEVLSQLFLLEQLPLSAKLHVVRMIFGGQVDAFDFHYMGYNFVLLKSLLEEAGFKNIQKVEKFDLFNDTSSFAPYGNKCISLNVKAYKDRSKAQSVTGKTARDVVQAVAGAVSVNASSTVPCLPVDSRVSACVCASFWPLRLKDGTIICSETSLKGMTSYVLLEQEDWFEDEMAFVRLFVQPHMLALDIGANHGVYALTLARRLESGHVWAFEPTQAPSTLLQASIAANGVHTCCTLVRAGLSDTDSEEVSLLALDAWWAVQEETRPVDFVKLDAEGEEIPILQGGEHFFASQSPLILVGYKHGQKCNDALVDALIQRGYNIYRLLPDINILVPYARDYQDGYLLNLFACKPDCAASLIQRGLLTDGQSPDMQLDLSKAQRLFHMPFAQPMRQEWQTRQDIPQGYWAALAAIMTVYEEDTAPGAKPLLLRFAWDALSKQPPNSSVRLSQVHVLHVLGYRAKAVEVAKDLLPQLEKCIDLPWPFVPPTCSYFTKEAGISGEHWARCVLQDFILSRSAYSTFFLGPDVLRDVQQWYKAGGHDLNLVRRAILLHKRQQHNIQVVPTAAILDPAQCSNAAVWQEICHGPMGVIFAEAEATMVHVLDIGASSHGKGTEPYAKLMHLGIARVTGFEPNAEACAQLNAMYAHNSAYTYVPCFVGGASAATVLCPNEALLCRYEQLNEIIAPTSDIEIETRTLADIAEVQAVDMIKIDVQGAELDVFEGAGAKLDEVLCIWTKVEFVEHHIKQPLFSEVEVYLRKKGFALHSFDGIASRGLKDWCAAGHTRGRQQAHWTDAIFIRPLESWEALSTPQLLKLAAILDAVLDARDYCHHALQLLDQRQNTHWAQRYAQIRG